MGDIETHELLMEISRFVAVIRRDNQLTTARDFLQYIYVNELNDFYPNLNCTKDSSDHPSNSGRLLGSPL